MVNAGFIPAVTRMNQQQCQKGHLAKKCCNAKKIAVNIWALHL